MVSIKDVADAAGVSTATVSRVLSDKPHVRGKVRDQVMTVVKELNYSPNRVARNLRARKSNVIGLLVSDIQNPFFTLISRAVEDAAYQQGMSIFLCNTDENPEKEAMYLKLMRDERVAGLILSPTHKLTGDFRSIVDPKLPMVVIDRRVTGAEIDTILIDNEDAAFRLTRHLLDHGCRRIGALFGSGTTTSKDRRKGYLAALKEKGLEPSPDLAIHIPAREQDGFAATVRLLAQPMPPDAIMTSNGLLAAGAFRALREQRVPIPGQLAFASFDETPWSTLVEPSITVIEQPTYEIGHSAVELLLKRIQDPGCACKEMILKSRLTIRRSCGCTVV
jgi:DNA-binding LacI/PurR family transcriptional regulator